MLATNLSLMANASFAEPSIPGRCFVDGELDCERPECHDICFTPPTPGYERMPIMHRAGMRSSDDEEAERILAGPRLKPPFKDDFENEHKEQQDAPNKTTQSTPIPDSPCPNGIDDDMLDTLKKKAFAKHWIKVAQEYLDIHFSDPKSNYETLQDNQDLFDQYTYRELSQSCYPQQNKCMKGPTKEVDKMLYDLFTTMISLRTERDRYYDSLKSCIDHPKCTDTFNQYNTECLNSSCQSEFLMSNMRDHIKKYEAKMAEQVTAIKALQCGPDRTKMATSGNTN